MPEQQVTFASVGDIMLDHDLFKIFEIGVPDFPFFNVVSELKDVDIAFGNLETPLTACQENVHELSG